MTEMQLSKVKKKNFVHHHICLVTPIAKRYDTCACICHIKGSNTYRKVKCLTCIYMYTCQCCRMTFISLSSCCCPCAFFPLCLMISLEQWRSAIGCFSPIVVCKLNIDARTCKHDVTCLCCVSNLACFLLVSLVLFKFG